MHKEVNVIQVVGKSHGKSEDATLIEENERFMFLGIADGKSGTQFGKIGGDISLKALFEYFNKNGSGNIDEMYEEEGPVLYATEIKRTSEPDQQVVTFYW